MIRFLTAGESHGPYLSAIVEGLPAGVPISIEFINNELRRRQAGYGRGARMQIESDEAEITSGLRFGKTIGSPIALRIRNRDWENWKTIMSLFPVSQEELAEKPIPKVTAPRPGHADLSGLLKYGYDDIRNVIERSSARETAIRVAVGAILKQFLLEFGVEITSHVLAIGNVSSKLDVSSWSIKEISEKAETSPVRCVDKEAELKMCELIDQAKEKGDTLGGIFEILADGIPVGLGSYMHYDLRLDGLIAQAIMSIPAIKGVEIGLGFQSANKFGSEVHDPIYYSAGKFKRRSNFAGGLEGGITTGERLVIRAAMKPLPTLRGIPIETVDIMTKETVAPVKERADVCAVPSAAVVGESVVAIELAKAMKLKFGGDSLDEMKANYNSYLKKLEQIQQKK